MLLAVFLTLGDHLGFAGLGWYLVPVEMAALAGWQVCRLASDSLAERVVTSRIDDGEELKSSMSRIDNLKEADWNDRKTVEHHWVGERWVNLWQVSD